MLISWKSHMRMLLLLPVLALCQPAQAQYRGLRLQVSAEKDFKLGKDWRLTLEQQVQLNPLLGRMPWLDAGLRDQDFEEIHFLDPDLVFIQYPGADDDDGDDDEGTDGEDDGNEEDDDEDGDDDEDDGDDDDEEDDDDEDHGNGTGTGSGPGTGGTGTQPGLPGGPVVAPGPSAAPDSAPLASPWIQWNLREIRSTTQIAIGYKLNKIFRVQAGLQYNLRQGSDSWTGFAGIMSTQRFFGNRLRLEGRLRVQNEMMRRQDEWRFRGAASARVRLRYDLGKLVPFSDTELVYRLARQDPGFFRYRLSGGLDFLLAEGHRLRASYSYQQRIGRRSDGADALNLTLGYAFEL